MIGIDQYDAWLRLSNAVSDAEGAARLFERLGFEQVTAPLLGRDATRDAVHRLVTGTLTQLTPDDSLVLFFAGHGHTQTTHAGDAVVKTGYVIPVDATQGHADAASTWLRLDAWLSDIARLPPRHILVIIDACHSGCALTAMHKWREDTAWPTTQLETLWARRSRRVITSALDGQRALDSGPYEGHSLFTGCLIGALSGGLGRGGKRVTTGRELGQYIHRRVTTFPGSMQIPDVGAFELDDRGDILIPLLSGRADERVPPGAAPNHARSPSVGSRRRASIVTPSQREHMPIADEDGTTHRLPAKSDGAAGLHRPGPGGLGRVVQAWRRTRTQVRAVLAVAIEHLSVRGSRLTGGILLLVCLLAVASGIAVTFVDPFGWRGGQAQGSLIQEPPGRSPEARIVPVRGVDDMMPPTPPLPGLYLGSNPRSGSAEVANDPPPRDLDAAGR